jgi:hypothetical protein
MLNGSVEVTIIGEAFSQGSGLGLGLGLGLG